NYVERAIVLWEGSELLADHLPPQLRGEAPPRPIRPRALAGADPETLAAELVRLSVAAAGPQSSNLYDSVVGLVERELIQQVLLACDRVQIKAAARLGINRNPLHKKLQEFRLEDSNGHTPVSAVDPVPRDSSE